MKFCWFTHCWLLLFVSMCQSYRRRNAFITTQMPLPHTVIDLWRMVYEHNCATVVMLNPWDETDKVFHNSFIYFCQSPLWVCSAKRRHHSPEWMILSHVNCFIQREVQWFQVLLGSLHPRSMGASRWSPPVLQVEAVKIRLASDSSDIHAVWPNRERRRAWTVAERCGCLVFHLTSSFCIS